MAAPAALHPHYARPDSIELTEDAEANRLVAQDPVAFLIGWILDQQIKVQHAFAGPLTLQARLGHLDARRIAAMPVQEFVDVMVEKPAVHRYGGAMGKRVHACMQHVVEEYDGDAERIWLEAPDYATLKRRLLRVPGFGKGKVPAVAAMLAKRFGLDITGFEDELMPYGSLSDVVVYDDLLAYQERKGVWKAEQKAAKAEGAAGAESGDA